MQDGTVNKPISGTNLKGKGKQPRPVKLASDHPPLDRPALNILPYALLAAIVVIGVIALVFYAL